MSAVYDTIGTGYAAKRQPDPRIARDIRAALGAAARVLNVGAGAGSYEPADLPVLAVEPSREMIRQRPAGRAPVVQALAEELPFPSASFDASLAVLTVHHWSDRRGGLTELARVARRVVIVTWDPACRDRFWLTSEYLPEIIARCGHFPCPTTASTAFWVPSGAAPRPISIPRSAGPCRASPSCRPRAWTRASRVSPTISAAAGGRSASDRCAGRTAPISGIVW